MQWAEMNTTIKKELQRALLVCRAFTVSAWKSTLTETPGNMSSIKNHPLGAC